jgi:hypothetical protein
MTGNDWWRSAAGDVVFATICAVVESGHRLESELARQSLQPILESRRYLYVAGRGRISRRGTEKELGAANLTGVLP